MNELDPWMWLFAFLNMAVLDVSWVGYNRATAQGRMLPSALWAVVLAALSGVNAIAAVENHWYLTATASGAFVGTIVGLVLAKRLEKKT